MDDIVSCVFLNANNFQPFNIKTVIFYTVAVDFFFDEFPFFSNFLIDVVSVLIEYELGKNVVNLKSETD